MTTLRYGWWAVRETPCVVAYQVWSVLTQRGYVEPFQRCTQCANIPEDHLIELAD